MNEHEPPPELREPLAAWAELDTPRPADPAKQRRVLVGVVGAAAERARKDAARARRLRRAAWGLVPVAAAACAILGYRLGGSPRGAEPPLGAVTASAGLSLARAGVLSVVSGVVTVEPRDELSTSTDTGTLRLSNGARVELARASRLGLGDDRSGGEVRLSQGAVDVTVPKLPPGGSFVVRTPRGDVVVHGTAFTVRLDDERVCVRVREGLVEVRATGVSTFVRPGEQVGCEAPAAAPVSAPVPSAPPSPPATVRNDARPPPRPESSLAEERRLLQRALAGERAGDVRAARGAADELLTRYPDSPLAGEARLLKSRLSRAP